MDGPSVGVGAVVIKDGKVLLVRRGKEPLQGRWVVPGGTVERGETLTEALTREVEEETGLRVEPGPVLAVFDRILREEGSVSYHYVIVDYLCEYRGGELRAGSDAEAAAFAGPDELPTYDLPAKALDVIRAGFARAGVPWPVGLVATPADRVPLDLK